MDGIFWTDEGGTYDVTRRDDMLVITGLNTRVEYRSTATVLVITGKERRQVARGKGASPFRTLGSRAILTLDTGEGIEMIPGVWLARS